ncbi:MAG: FKBP-type peptidyl-prolyl cis-trans isomerase [Acidobacteriia bacterium]|nr:FKBP-type peptidyl-prolyl cis-trans isomerase [Terriglobia bacterium]
MSMRWMMVLGMVLLTGVAPAQDTPALKTEKDKVSYALGVDLGHQLKKLSIDVDPAVFGQGLTDALSGSKALLTEAEVSAAIARLPADVKLRSAQAMTGTSNQALLAQMAEENKKAGEAFLAENKTKEGVVTLPSGLQYKILKAGDGKKPTLDDTVVCHYRATLLNGTEFFNSYKRNQPMTVAVNGVIKGWTEALQLMPVGSKWQLVVPPNLAYGELGSGPIGPNSTLIYEVELISIKEKP